MAYHARLHILFSKKSPMAIVIRRGPSKQTAVIGWNRTDDSFVIGQWLKGKIYHYRSDLSPDGRHWIYFAMSSRGDTWTAVAKAPYLKALDFYPKGDAWNGGGLFVSNRNYWLNDGGPYTHQRQRHTSGLSLTQTWGGEPNFQGECPGVYFLRLARDGWSKTDTEQVDKTLHVTRFYKQVNAHWLLWKLFHMGFPHPEGKGPYHESHLLRNAGGVEIQLPDAEWADIDGSRFLWAEQGEIMSGRVTKDGLEDRHILFDANPLQFTELTAPY